MFGKVGSTAEQQNWQNEPREWRCRGVKQNNGWCDAQTGGEKIPLVPEQGFDEAAHQRVCLL
jgi:hypothetical protein